jgi:hypothetical protein
LMLVRSQLRLPLRASVARHCIWQGACRTSMPRSTRTISVHNPF